MFCKGSEGVRKSGIQDIVILQEAFWKEYEGTCIV